jgi:hypothetical protein
MCCPTTSGGMNREEKICCCPQFCEELDPNLEGFLALLTGKSFFLGSFFLLNYFFFAWTSSKAYLENSCKSCFSDDLANSTNVEAIRFHGGMRANIPRFRPGQATRQLPIFCHYYYYYYYKEQLLATRSKIYRMDS